MVDKSQKVQIRNLLIVLGSGIAAAFLFGLFMLSHYGPTGQYTVHDALLAPQVTDKLNYNDYNPKTGGSDRYVFDKFEFSYFDADKKQWIKQTIPQANYTAFYNLVESEKSILNPSDETISLFNKGAPSSLFIDVRTESSAAYQLSTKVFQEVQFNNQGDYYRVELHEQNPSGKWVYFYHPQIYQQSHKLLLGT